MNTRRHDQSHQPENQMDMDAVTNATPIYEEIYEDTRAMIMTLSGLSMAVLEEAQCELGIVYEFFNADYRGGRLPDAHIGILEMLRQSPLPWPPIEESSLCDLNEPQFFFVWAWYQNIIAKYCLDGSALAHGWIPAQAQDCGIVAAISAVKSVSHAKLLMSLGVDRKAQDAA